MSKQTINIGASPNDGTGTPLRTSFDYTNQNFTELYTALGGGVGLPGATTQVIFNDGGTNLAGDAGLVYNKTTDALTVAGLVTAGSATITGALTVDTTTLVVNPSGYADRVGIGTATPAYLVDVLAAGASTVNDSFNVVRFTGASAVANDFSLVGPATSQVRLNFSHPTASGNGEVGYDHSTNRMRFVASGNEQYRIDPLGVFTWLNGAGGTRMTLDSTGLGVGVTPSAGKFEVLETGTGSGLGGIFASTATAGGNPGFVFRTASTNRWSISLTGTAGAESIRFYDVNAAATRMTIDSSGNVGIGVTPSAWATGYKAIQGQIGGFALSNDNSSNNQFRLSSNAYFDTTDSRWEYYGTSTATAYEQRVGEHRFFNAVSGSANTAITFTQAMTLDASGNLLVGKAVTLFSTVGVEASQAGFLSLTNSASTNAATNLSLYSTGAAAFRFYVGLGGTVFATNVVISAISDARYKENVQDIDVGLNAILSLKPRKFDWKAGKGKDIKGDRGFIAQEFETVFPNLVDEWKDPAPEGEAPYKSVRQDLIPVLVKAIQELTARVQTLEAR